MNAAATLTRELEQRLIAPAVDAVASDGRKQRWARHKEERRAELISGTIDAVRVLGPDAGMDEIAGHIGVSKTVLYRYFSDKSDLAAAVSEAFMHRTLIPQLNDALSDDLGDYELVHAVIAVYVRIVAANPNVYRYIVGAEETPGAVAAAQRLLSDAIESTLRSRLLVRSADAAGAATWSFAMVGGVQAAVDRWLELPHTAADRLADELTMLVWGGVAGIVTANGSPAEFTANPPTIPRPPTRNDHPNTDARVPASDGEP